jgi:hypothetical protein
MKAEAAREEPSPRGPKSIGKVFAARHLSRSGPVSYGYEAFGFEDIMFVDIGVYLHNGQRAMNRTLVIKDQDGKWYVHPAPDVSPLLSEGLNEEKESVLDLTDVYELEPEDIGPDWKPALRQKSQLPKIPFLRELEIQNRRTLQLVFVN